jgi:hypothetical protein
MNHALALYLVETIGLLDPESPEYPLQVLTLVESILENPDIVLIRQLDKIKTLKMAEMKAAGVEYDERIAELEKLEYPKPHREFIYGSFGEFEAKHPWVGRENIRPKSIAREMVEEFYSFSDYIKEYDLQRAEGVLLRYLSDVYKTLVQSVPASAKDEGVEDIVVYFRAMVRQADSSLLDEWERMRTGVEGAARPAERNDPLKPPGITQDKRAFTVLLRNELFHLQKALANRDYGRAVEIVQPSESFGEARHFEAAMTPYFAEHASIRLDPKARGPKNTLVDEEASVWRLRQIICDPEEHDDWVIEAIVDLAKSDELGRPAISVQRIGT